MPIVATRFTDADLFLFNEGNHFRLYDKLGAHSMSLYGKRGTYFAVWAPNAERVSVIGDFNRWDPSLHSMTPRGMSGIWEGFASRAKHGQKYKYRIWPRGSRKSFDKADPVGLFCEEPPETCSRIWHKKYKWSDQEWMTRRHQVNALDAPMSIYEVHLGSWMGDESGARMNYADIAPKLAQHIKAMGFTHVELMPVMEHPFYGSWGYQVTGYFAPTSRYGNPEDFAYMIDYLHQQGIGVILDWSPAHFPNDKYALAKFDGTHLFEHADPRKGIHPDWDSLIFNYGRYEVKSFLISSANYWLDKFHADGLRVDGVASMLYLDYSREEGQWIPNEDGSNENRDAVGFLRKLNDYCSLEHPDVRIIAEESTAWPKVTRPSSDEGLGFDYKWDMGWMHDTLAYMALDPVHRKSEHNKLTFRAMYSYSENFLLPLSHDEVVHGKGSLLSRMPGDKWQKFANLRLLLSYAYAQPGKKLLFMGSEFGVEKEWDHESMLDWSLNEQPEHAGIGALLTALNRMYRDHRAMHVGDVREGGFEWIHADDSDSSVISFLRKGDDGDPPVLAIFNFTPVVREGYRIGVPTAGSWRVLLSSDSPGYGGTGDYELSAIDAEAEGQHGREHSISLTLPPLGCLFLLPGDSSS